MPLENFYSGDECWFEFAALFETQWAKCSFQRELLEKLGGAEDLAMVIYGTLLGTSMDWVEKEVPALEGLKPVDCLNSESGVRRLRTCLHRFPR